MFFANNGFEEEEFLEDLFDVIDKAEQAKSSNQDAHINSTEPSHSSKVEGKIKFIKQ